MTCPLAEPQRKGYCHWCSKKLAGRRTRWCSTKCSRDALVNHRWTNARKAAKAEAAFYRCARCYAYYTEIEVNHIVPCKGKHGVWGCWHHADNLECLCHKCHLEATAEQRAAGLL